MLAMSDRDGYVWASVIGVANRAKVTVEQAEIALKKFQEPDPLSRSKEFEGRRIEEVDRGWLLLNKIRFRDMRDEDEHRRKERERKRAQRARAKAEREALALEPPGDWNGSPDETICPADLASRAEKILPEMVTRLPGSTLEQLRASANRCVAHYTIGRGMGQKRRHWMKVLRGWVTKDHGDNNLKNGGKKTDLQQILERAARIQAESKS